MIVAVFILMVGSFAAGCGYIMAVVDKTMKDKVSRDAKMVITGAFTVMILGVIAAVIAK